MTKNLKIEIPHELTVPRRVENGLKETSHIHSSPPFFCVCFQLAVGEQLLKSQSTDPFLNLEIDAGVSNVQRSQSWLGNIGPAHQEIDTASSHGPQMQDAFLSPLSNKGRYHFKS